MANHVESIAVESARVAFLAEGSDLTASVPACPEWSLRDLVMHLGSVQRSWAWHLGRADPSEPPPRPVFEPPSDRELSAWMSESTRLLINALREAGDETPCWTWWGEPFTSAAVGRHQVQEVTVHRFDAESALGATTPLPQAVAVDGIAEFLEIMIDDECEQPVGQLTLVATDSSNSWETGPSPHPTVAIEGTASDLELLLYRRIPLSATHVIGDSTLAQAFIDAPELA